MAVLPIANPIAQVLSAQGVNASANTQNSSLNGSAQPGTDFNKFLNQAIQQLDDLQQTANATSVGLATGQIQDFSTAMVALQKADLSMQLAVEVRDKALDAYNEIMRMQM